MIVLITVEEDICMFEVTLWLSVTVCSATTRRAMIQSPGLIFVCQDVIFLAKNASAGVHGGVGAEGSNRTVSGFRCKAQSKFRL
jgi:hypothetical protein